MKDFLAKLAFFAAFAVQSALKYKYQTLLAATALASFILGALIF